MKKIISVIGILLVWHMVGLLQSCDPCGSDGPIVFKLSSISSNLIRITEREELFGQSNSPISASEVYDLNEGYIRYDSIGINISSNIDQLSHKQGSVLNAAYACSPVEYFDVMTQISVTSDQDYNKDYLAGDDLNSIVLAQREYYLPISAIPLAEFMNEDGNSQMDGSDLLLTFSTAPDADEIHNLKITITTDDGEVFTEEITGLKISK